MTAQFRIVPTLETASLWPEVVEVLQLALDRIAWAYKPEDIQSRIAHEQMHLGVFEVDGRVTTACVTEVIQFPRCRALNVFLIGGNGFGMWTQWFEDIRNVAKILGCRYVIGTGRDGWERVVEKNGMRKVGNLYRTEVCDG